MMPHLFIFIGVALLVAIGLLLGVTVSGIKVNKTANEVCARAEEKDQTIQEKTNKAFARVTGKRPEDINTGSFMVLRDSSSLHDA